MSTAVTKITMTEFESLLAKSEAPIEVRMTTKTSPKMLVKHRETKAPNPFTGGLFRVTTQKVVLGESYSRAVNAQRQAEGVEGTFSAQGLWKSKQYPEGAGERDSAFTVRHRGNGKRYFAVQLVPDTTSSIWVTPTGEEVAYEDVKPFMSESKPSNGNQGVETEVIWRTIDLGSVRQVQLGDVTYEIEASESADASE